MDYLTIHSNREVSHLSLMLTPVEEAYVPSPGDYISFRWSGAEGSVNVRHVGIAAAVAGDSLTTWERNSGGKVVSRLFALDDSQIVGFGKPNYAAA